ncbi:glycerol-3-phosphate dehydrogenase/oxidase [Fulvimarina sp. MAC3]|uniref:glycerol-3-phosphate dehydrogenase/oxidase n=1 Tax=Fulvimarina sp. MAC3 TaxID=3148887 RepID=UPI0031FE38BC
MRSRRELIDTLRESGGWNGVVVVGGGINGIGVYRDLAAQGVPVLLVEKGDFCSGTSAAPSRLIHGGLRYLETGEFDLVRESVEERNVLLLNAPHLVRPLPVWVPMFSYLKGLPGAALRFLGLRKDPGPKGAALIKVGLVIYDRFGKVKETMPKHRMVSLKEAFGAISGLTKSVRAVAEYYDARVISPERLGVEIVADAEADEPRSLAIPYMAAVASKDGGLQLEDVLTGERMRIEPSLVVNCAGPWLDEVNGRIGISEKLVGGTKGSHLVLRAPELARELGERMIYFETPDHRACLIYATDDEHCLLGTTDIRVENPSDNVCSDEEIDYLFDVLQKIIPDETFTRKDIVFTYAGVRPLPKTGSGSTGAISRDHAIRVFEPSGKRSFTVLGLVGGKWTTYRSCAEEIVDDVLERIGASRKRSTRDLPIGGGHGLEGSQDAVTQLAGRLASRFGLDKALTLHLARRYGSKAEAMLEGFGEDGFEPLASASTYLVGEIRHAAETERVTHLTDIVLRRTMLPFEGYATSQVIDEVGAIAGQTLGWSPEKLENEVGTCKQVLVTQYRVEIEPSPDHAQSRVAV